MLTIVTQTDGPHYFPATKVVLISLVAMKISINHIYVTLLLSLLDACLVNHCILSVFTDYKLDEYCIVFAVSGVKIDSNLFFVFAKNASDKKYFN